FFASLPPRLRERGLPHQLLVTTSYDLALEQALLEAGEEFDVVSYLASGRDRGRFCHRDPSGATRVIDLPNKYAAPPPPRRPRGAAPRPGVLALARRRPARAAARGIREKPCPARRGDGAGAGVSLLAAPPVSPFKGLAAFDDSELDSLFFFGREHEREIVVANMLASRLTILYGESGVGKSSLLGAAVVRDLREEAPGAPVVLHDTWSGSLEGITAELAGAAEGYLILDQFEEYFLYHGDDPGPGTLLHDLPELLHGSRVNV